PPDDDRRAAPDLRVRGRAVLRPVFGDASAMTGPAPQAIFFDMDGTILDWQTGMEESWRIACVDGCHARDGIDAEELLDAVHVRRKWFWAHPEHSVTGRLDLDAATHTIVTHALADLKRDDDALAARIAQDYRARRINDMAPY